MVLRFIFELCPTFFFSFFSFTWRSWTCVKKDFWGVPFRSERPGQLPTTSMAGRRIHRSEDGLIISLLRMPSAKLEEWKQIPLPQDHGYDVLALTAFITLENWVLLCLPPVVPRGFSVAMQSFEKQDREIRSSVKSVSVDLCRTCSSSPARRTEGLLVCLTSLAPDELGSHTGTEVF